MDELRSTSIGRSLINDFKRAKQLPFFFPPIRLSPFLRFLFHVCLSLLFSFIIHFCRQRLFYARTTWLDAEFLQYHWVIVIRQCHMEFVET